MQDQVVNSSFILLIKKKKTFTGHAFWIPFPEPSNFYSEIFTVHVFDQRLQKNDMGSSFILFALKVMKNIVTSFNRVFLQFHWWYRFQTALGM